MGKSTDRKTSVEQGKIVQIACGSEGQLYGLTENGGVFERLPPLHPERAFWVEYVGADAPKRRRKVGY
jgi:hypothetical protein